jgi:hypothetical protein
MGHPVWLPAMWQHIADSRQNMVVPVKKNSTKNYFWIKYCAFKVYDSILITLLFTHCSRLQKIQ